MGEARLDAVRSSTYASYVITGFGTASLIEDAEYVPWKGTGRRRPRMRYSGTALRLAQSSLTAPFCCQLRVSVPHHAVIRNPTKLSGFSRLGKTIAAGVKCLTLRRGLEGRWTRRGCLGNVKGGLRGGDYRPSALGYGGRSFCGCACWRFMGRQGSCVWSRITCQDPEAAA
jgi:hypothetical protein